MNKDCDSACDKEEQSEGLRLYLDRARHLRSLYAQIDLTAYGEANEEPVIKAEVINKPEDISLAQIEQGHSTLENTYVQMCVKERHFCRECCIDVKDLIKAGMTSSDTHIEQQGWDRCVALNMDHGKKVG